MKKILNTDVSNVVEEMLQGYLLAYRHFYKRVKEYHAIVYRGHRKDKVALVIGGGSGHEPMFIILFCSCQQFLWQTVLHAAIFVRRRIRIWYGQRARLWTREKGCCLSMAAMPVTI